MAPIYPVYEHNTDGSFNLDANGNRIYDYGLNRIALSNSNAIALLHLNKTNRPYYVHTPDRSVP